METVERVEQEAEALERRLVTLRKLIDVANELGRQQVAELLGLPTPITGQTTTDKAEGNGKGNVHSGDQTTIDPPALVTITTEPSEKPPRGREAIRAIVHERPGVWSLAKLRAELKRREWFTSAKAAEVAVTRLMALGECRRVGKGLYEFPAPAKEADA